MENTFTNYFLSNQLKRDWSNKVIGVKTDGSTGLFLIKNKLLREFSLAKKKIKGENTINAISIDT